MPTETDAIRNHSRHVIATPQGNETTSALPRKQYKLCSRLGGDSVQTISDFPHQRAVPETCHGTSLGTLPDRRNHQRVDRSRISHVSVNTATNALPVTGSSCTSLPHAPRTCEPNLEALPARSNGNCRRLIAGSKKLEIYFNCHEISPACVPRRSAFPPIAMKWRVEIGAVQLAARRPSNS
jgi:hypothetical protein